MGGYFAVFSSKINKTEFKAKNTGILVETGVNQISGKTYSGVDVCLLATNKVSQCSLP